MTPTDSPRHGHAGGRLNNPDVGHEDSDINVRSVLSFGAGMVVIAVACMVIDPGAVRRPRPAGELRAIRRRPPPVAAPAGQLPRAPHLLTNEPAALAKFHAEEDGSTRRIRLGRSDRRCDTHSGRRSQEAARPARTAGADRTRPTRSKALTRRRWEKRRAGEQSVETGRQQPPHPRRHSPSGTAAPAPHTPTGAR